MEVYTTNVDGAGISDVPVSTPVEMGGVSVTYFPAVTLGQRFYYSRLMGTALRAHIKKFDVVHTHAQFVWPSYEAGRVARLHDVPLVHAPRGMIDRTLVQQKSGFLKRAWIYGLDRANLEGAAALHVTSEIEKAEIEAFGLAIHRYVIIPNGVDDIEGPVQHAAQGGSGNAPVILFLGRISWKKGIDRLIEALTYVPAAELVIAGNDEEGYRGVLDGIVARLGLADRVRFVGEVSGSEKRALFASASVFALPSQSENFGVAVIEAMQAGCPVVVTPEVGLADMVARTHSGIVCAGGPEVLGAGIAGVLTDREELARMSANAVAAVRRDYLWPRIADQMLRTYAELSAGAQ
ncbi:Glycosyl transferase/GT4 [Candidatus Phaeomarinobacter ectocarpi]|uniref:Glycosyl transferase/GT4 n=1 Tax=Candidatus Phaeomarinibacter ectocarpi TaxID=1458461 RepID=X5ME72_9HYPH|nr:Glycosyl transferase/GT4 [Candidatus Phaeomarinobacter ectocarpi]